MDNFYTRRLAEFVANLRFEDIPKSVIDHIKLVALDGLGCGLYGSTTLWAQKVREMALEQEPDGKVSIWGTKKRSSLPQAALANGTAIHSYEIDDFHTDAMLHGCSTMLPAALGLAQQRPGTVSGKDFITSLVAGYEVAVRVSYCMGRQHIIQGWHAPMTSAGIWGAATTAGKALRLDEEQMVHCLGHAGTQASGLMAVQFGSMMKRLHAGKASQSGLYSALLAEKGFTGITDVFEAEYGGFCTTFSASKDNFDRNKLVEGLGERWESAAVGFKFYSCCGAHHTALDAMRQAREENHLKPEDIDKVLVRMNKAAYEHTGWKYVPNSITTAQFNATYGIATIILEGESFIDQYTEDRLRAPHILAVIDKVETMHDPELDGAGSTHRTSAVEVKTKDGRAFKTRVDYPRGTAVNPPKREDVMKKFHLLASKVISREQESRLVDKAQSVEQLADASALVEDLATDRV